MLSPNLIVFTQNCPSTGRERVGEAFLAAKKIVAEHGDDWTTMLSTICRRVQFSDRTAHDYMLLAQHPDLSQSSHIFVAFLAYCLYVTLRARLKPLAPGLTPRAVLDKLAAVQMLDVQTDGRTLVMSRYTEFNADQKLLVKQLKLDLPPQPTHHSNSCSRPGLRPVVETYGMLPLNSFYFFFE